MRRIDQPTIDDAALIDYLARSRSESALIIRGFSEEIKARYAEYHRNSGNPWSVLITDQFEEIKDSLINLYNDPPVALAFISAMRVGLVGACPVCGRDGLGTLDHYLPKSYYQEFAFYSKNLVPACDRCNAKKGDVFRGCGAGRGFHPYFHDFGNSRILTVEISEPFEAPLITAVPFEVDGDDFDVVSWHIENIIRPAGFDQYQIGLWSALVAHPENFVRAGAGWAERQMDIEDALNFSKNSWRSAFYHGLHRKLEAISYIESLV